MRRTMLTLHTDGFRRRRTRAAYAHLVAVPEHSVSKDTTSADSLDLRAALHALGPQERTVVVLRFYDDLTVPEIADRMGLAEGTVKRYLSNALGRLERRLGPIDEPSYGAPVSAAVPARRRILEGGRS